MTCEIIIVKYGLPELEAECVASLEQTTGVDFVVTLHDNYEADEHLSTVWNRLIEASEAEYICLLNNDTKIVEEDWLEKLLDVFEKQDKVGAVGPITNRASGVQGNVVWQKKMRKLKIVGVKGPLVGFCLVFPKALWEEVRGFDEEYALYGEDSDFCMELKKRGYLQFVRPDVFVYHHGKGSTPIALARGKDITQLKWEAKERFRKKWHPKRAVSKAPPKARTPPKPKTAKAGRIRLKNPGTRKYRK